MNINAMNNSLLSDLQAFNLKDLLRGKKLTTMASDIATQALPSAPSDIALSDSLETQLSGISKNSLQQVAHGNVMAQNFTNTNQKQSKYLAAKLDSFTIAKATEQAEKNSLTSLLAMFGGIAGPSVYDSQDNKKTGGASEAHVRMMLRLQAEKQMMEDAEKHLKKERERLENQGELSQNPQDGLIAVPEPTPPVNATPDIDVATVPLIGTPLVSPSEAPSPASTAPATPASLGSTYAPLDIRV